MRIPILVCGSLSSIVSIMGTILALHVVAPGSVDAQEARIRAERIAVVDGNGADRAVMRSGADGRAGVDVISPAGLRRISLDLGSPQFIPGGTPDAARLLVFPPEGSGPGNPAIAGLGTGPGGEDSLLYLRDRQGQVRILLRVDGSGNPSIEMRDADGNVTWQAQ
jgi:hypothetical protein